MDQEQPQFTEVGEGASRRRIGYRIDEAPGDTALFWLSGFLSDMTGTKVQALTAWARTRGLPLLRFDYSAHGVSDGELRDATIGDWLEESIAMLALLGERGVVLIGSSMGGWLALLLARQLAKLGRRLKGMVLIAPAYDMTQTLMWDAFPPHIKEQVERDGVYVHPSAYGDSYTITRRLIEEGRNHLLADDPFDPGCPVRIIQGMQDPDVPWRHALALIELMTGSDIELTLIKGAAHRLSEPEDLRRLERTIEALVDGA